MADSAAAGEEVILLRDGKALARIAPLAEEWPKRKLGFFEGKYKIPDVLWEIAIKRSQGKTDFQVDPRLLQEGLLGNGYRQLEIGSEHVMSVGTLLPIHRGPFDRLLLAQAMVERFALSTSDQKVARYPGRIQRV